MRKPRRTWERPFAAGMLAMMLIAAGPALAADATASPQGDSWASIAKLPDWSGLWEPIFGPRQARAENPPLTPDYAAKVAATKAAKAQGAGEEQVSTNCIPPGMPTIMGQPYPLEILFTPGRVTVTIEAFSQIRRIYTDGRKHPADPDPTYNGHSIGHWEGDTLVVDTVGLVPDTPLGTYGDAYNFIAAPHSDQMHIVERMRLSGPGELTIATTVDDPKALTKPWTKTTVYGGHKDWTLSEYVCEQNNRNFVDQAGHAGISLDHK